MKSLVLFLITLMFFTSFNFAQSYGEIEINLLKDILSDLKEKNQSISNFQANFKEISSSGLQLGKLYISRPDKLKIEYFSGERIKSEIYYNADKLYFNFIENKIVYEQNLQEKLINVNMPGLIAFDYLEENYNFNFFESTGMDDLFSKEEIINFNLSKKSIIKAYHFTLTPKDITKQLDKLEIWFNDIGKLVRNYSENVKGEVRDVYFYNFSEELYSENFFNFIPSVQARVVKNILP